jgi:hypothetical protein
LSGSQSFAGQYLPADSLPIRIIGGRGGGPFEAEAVHIPGRFRSADMKAAQGSCPADRQGWFSGWFQLRTFGKVFEHET